MYGGDRELILYGCAFPGPWRSRSTRRGLGRLDRGKRDECGGLSGCITIPNIAYDVLESLRVLPNLTGCHNKQQGEEKKDLASLPLMDSAISFASYW